MSQRVECRVVGVRWWGGWIGLLLAISGVVLPGCAWVHEPDPIYFSTKDWHYRGVRGYTLSSEHYLIHSTYTRAPFIFALPGFLETCYGAYSRLLPGEPKSDALMKTYLFKNRREWVRFTEAFAPVRAATYKHIRRGGYSTRGVTVSQYSRRASTLSTLAHEGLHQYLEVTGRHRIPAWINEGLACYFEAFDLVDERPVFNHAQNALRRPALRELIATDALFPLSDILSTNAGVVIHLQSRQVQYTYAQWWSLVLYLLDDSEGEPYHAGFRKLLSELGSDVMRRKINAYISAYTEGQLSRGIAIFRVYITEDLHTFESKYADYLQRLLKLTGS